MEHYWGGEWDQYYYERESGRIVGEVWRGTGGAWHASYSNAINPTLGTFIDKQRACKAVEEAHQRNIDWYARMNEQLGYRTGVVLEVEPKRKWWQVWKKS